LTLVQDQTKEREKLVKEFAANGAKSGQMKELEEQMKVKIETEINDLVSLKSNNLEK
jgi:hypothetical protein